MTISHRLAAFSLFEYVFRFGKKIKFDSRKLKEINPIREFNNLSANGKPLNSKLTDLEEQYSKLHSNYSLAPFELYESPIPKNAFRKMAGFYKRNTAITVKYFTDRGFIGLKRDYCKEKKWCRVFFVFLPRAHRNCKRFISLDEFRLSQKENQL